MQVKLILKIECRKKFNAHKKANTVTRERTVVKKYLLKHTGFFSKQMKVTDTQQMQQNVQTCHSLIQKAKQRINCKAMNSNDK